MDVLIYLALAVVFIIGIAAIARIIDKHGKA